MEYILLIDRLNKQGFNTIRELKKYRNYRVKALLLDKQFNYDDVDDFQIYVYTLGIAVCHKTKTLLFTSNYNIGDIVADDRRDSRMFNSVVYMFLCPKTRELEPDMKNFGLFLLRLSRILNQ